MFAVIRSYDVTMDLPFSGADGVIEEAVLYEPFWDAPFHPERPEVWENEMFSFRYWMDYCRQKGITPIVAIFIPKETEREKAAPHPREWQKLEWD